jgi:hypothetical protein
MRDLVFVEAKGADRRSIATRLLKAADELEVDRQLVESVRDGFRAPELVIELAFDGGSPAGPEGPPAPPIDDPGNKTEGRLVPPPRNGKGSGTDAWHAYAGHAGVEVPADATRDEVIAALDAADVPTTTADDD